MKRSYLFICAFFLLAGGALFAQGEIDAYRLSQTGLSGTARYMGMGGAFGALGGDVSVMSANPAGLGVFRSSEVVTTFDLSMANTQTDWNGSKIDKDKMKFNFSNIAYVGYVPTGNSSGIKGWNFGFAYNRVKNFNRSYRMSGTQAASLADYAASRATNAYNVNDKMYGIPENALILTDNYDPYFNGVSIAGQNRQLPWLPVLGYEGGFFGTQYAWDDVYHSGFGQKVNGTWQTFSPNLSTLDVRERGAIDDYTFSLATNISDKLFLGASFVITDIDYRYTSTYDEDFAARQGASRADHLYLDNQLISDGSGYSFNVGAIVSPVDFLRLGVAYNSPRWYKIDDHYYAEAGTYISSWAKPELNANTPDDKDYYTPYELRTPDKWIFSAAGIIGREALISVDYEIQNYKNMKLSPRGSMDQPYGDNEFIKQDFGVASTLRVGAEYKVTPQFAVRAGGIWQTSPMKTEIKKGDTEVLTSGTIPNYTVDDGLRTTFTVGFGYRFTPQFYADLTCLYSTQKEQAYAFSNTYFKDDTYHVSPVVSVPASLKTNTTRLALTFGYKF